MPVLDTVSLNSGQELPPLEKPPVSKTQILRYAGASGDDNLIHTDVETARERGLDGVIAHGMLTMAEAVRVVTDWVGDPGAVVDYGVRFTKPVVVPDDDTGATLEVAAAVGAKLDDNLVRVDITATSAGTRVLGRAQAVVRLP